ncbi:MAG TPA: transglutaminase family protein [Micromonosporaceae bacterium]|nr:transglutaminase family protein [Micromonosporaceae bacterium]
MTSAPARSARCDLTFQVSEPATIIAQVAVTAERADLDESLEVRGDGAPVPARELPRAGEHGGRQHLIHAPAGTLTITYSATVRPAASPPAPVTDLERVVALRPSRYCPSDRVVGLAGATFGGHPAGPERVRAICDYVAERTFYQSGASDATTDAIDTLLTGTGVCRDYAHLVAMLCRAVEVPARVAAVYAPGLSPMDFHLVVETEIDGLWRVWDATRLAPRTALVRIATGRDAADVAFATVISGRALFTGMEITAVVDGDLPVDDHNEPVFLP